MNMVSIDIYLEHRLNQMNQKALKIFSRSRRKNLTPICVISVNGIMRYDILQYQ